MYIQSRKSCIVELDYIVLWKPTVFDGAILCNLPYRNRIAAGNKSNLLCTSGGIRMLSNFGGLSGIRAVLSHALGPDDH